MTLKIAIIGQSPFGESVAKRIQEIQNTEIVCIIPPFNNKEDPLYQYLELHQHQIFLKPCQTNLEQS